MFRNLDTAESVQSIMSDGTAGRQEFRETCHTRIHHTFSLQEKT